MSDSDVPVTQMTRDALDAYLSTFQILPPHIKFDKEKYQRDVEAGLITRSRNVNNSPYFPHELKAAHGATNIKIAPSVGKKRVVIATTIGYNWPEAYIQRCFDAFCMIYDLWQLDALGNPILVAGNKIRPSMEVINLAPLGRTGYGNPSVATSAQASENQGIIDAIHTQIENLGTPLTGPILITNRSGLNNIATMPVLPNLSTDAETQAQKNKIGWLGELILNFWAIAMNPNAHFRIINSNSPTLYEMANTVIYASTDSNFTSRTDVLADDPRRLTTDYVNMSWGDGVPGMDRPQYDDEIFINPRICYFGAAGNHRWAGYPATSSNVMCVGATNLYYDSSVDISGTINPVVQLWVGSNSSDSTGGGDGSGVGFSHYDNSNDFEGIPFGSPYPRPAHQPTILAGVSDFNNNIRVCPDICSLGDPVTGLLFVYANKPGSVQLKIAGEITGGTSLATPLMCGLFSHLSQRRINDNLPPFTTRINNTSNNLQKLLYDNFKQTSNNFTQSSPLFYDITGGPSTVLPTKPELGIYGGRTFSAGPGYDITTGLGFANMQNIQTAIFQTSQPIDSGSGINNGNNNGGGGTFSVVGTPSVAPRVDGGKLNLVRININ